MKLSVKLIIVFLALSLVPIVILSLISISVAQNTMKNSIGINFENLVKEKAEAIDTIIENKIAEAQILARSQFLKDAVRKSNLKYINKSDDEIQKYIGKIDKEWIEANDTTETINQILNSILSRYLMEYLDRDKEKYGEIIVTDAKGATVAMTEKLSDYYQADEGWWQYSFDKGRGELFIDDRGYDSSVNALVLGIVVPIKEEEKIIGILKINYKVEGILDIVTGTNIGISGHSFGIFLTRSSGSLIIHPPNLTHSKLTAIEKNQIGAGKISWVEDIERGKRTIMAHAPVKADLYSRVPAPGERKGISGERWEPTKWHLFLEIDQDEAFASINKLKKYILTISFSLFILIIFLVLVFSRTITTPIKELVTGAYEIGKGNLNYEIKLKSKDEIGDLANSFETMRKEVKHSKENLEILVREKTKELAERVKELEKVRDLTSDSEIYAEEMRLEKEEALKNIKMLEKGLDGLKKDIEKLKKRGEK